MFHPFLNIAKGLARNMVATRRGFCAIEDKLCVEFGLGIKNDNKGNMNHGRGRVHIQAIFHVKPNMLYARHL